MDNTKNLMADTSVERRADSDTLEIINSANLKQGVQAEHELTLRQAVRNYKKAIGWSALVSMAIIMESYDTLLLGSFYAYPTFQQKFGVPIGKGKYSVPARWQLCLSTVGNASLICGGFLNGFLVDIWGPKKVMIGCNLVLIATIFPLFFAPRIEILLLGQILCGLPWGIFASLVPTFAAEIVPMVLRGYLTTYVNLCWVIGHLIASGVLRGLVENKTQWGWRIPMGLQWMWPPLLAVAFIFIPDSPWWHVRKGRIAEAEHIVARLYTHDYSSPLSADEHIKQSVALMAHTIQTEQDFNIGSSWAECFRGTNLRRTEIACVSWGCQILPGFAMQGYVTYFFTLAGVPTTESYKLTIGVYALAFTGTFLSWFLQARLGRRTIYIMGLCMMAPLMLIVGFIGCAPSTPSLLWTQSVMLLLWFFSYGLTVGPIPYAIAAEVGASNVRGKTVALARNFYYVLSIINSVCAPYMLNPTAGNLRGKAAFPAGVCSLCMLVWAWFRLPETKGRTFRELDILFEKRLPARQFSGYVFAEDNVVEHAHKS